MPLLFSVRKVTGEKQGFDPPQLGYISIYMHDSSWSIDYVSSQ
jgi:hypothetical protein